MDEAQNALLNAQEKLRDAQAQHAALYEQAPVLLLLVDGERKVRVANRLAIEAAGDVDPVGRRGGEALRCVHALEDPLGCGFGPRCASCVIRRTVLDAIEGGREHRQVPARMLLDGGDGLPREAHFQVSATPLTVGGERLVQVCLLDVTDLTLAEERCRSLFEHMFNGIAYCRMIFEDDRPVDFVYEAVNPAFAALTGLGEVRGRRVSEVIPGIRERDPELFEICGRVVRTGVPERVEIHLASLDMCFDVSAFRPREG
jgi:PAS domain-containing protein